VAVLASVLPDADWLGYVFGVPYDSLFGHRGFTHSLVFAALLAALAAGLSLKLGASPSKCFWVVFVSGASHGFFDAMTSGGLGVAFFSPFSNHRYFFPWRPILVSPLNPASFAGERAVGVLLSELLRIWIPCLFAGLAVYRLRSWRRAGPRA
jgi:inner membrane protein